MPDDSRGFLRDRNDAAAAPPVDAVTTARAMQFVPSERFEKTRSLPKLDMFSALIRLADDFDRLLASITFGPPFAVVHEHASSVSSDAAGSILRAVYMRRAHVRAVDEGFSVESKPRDAAGTSCFRDSCPQMTSALLCQVRDTTLPNWKMTSDGTLLRVAGDWYQALALQRDKHRGGWFPNAWVECLAIHDGPLLCDLRIVSSTGQLWTKDALLTLGDAFTTQAHPDPSKPLTSAAILQSLTQIERRSFAPPGPFDDANPRVLLALAVCAVRDGDAAAAHAAAKRALRSPGSGGLSSTWSVTEWANDFARHLELGCEDAARFLDRTRDSSLEDLGRLE